MSRQRVSLSEPPDPVDLSGGPAFAPSSTFLRSSKSIFPSPWFFSSNGDGRFDLTDQVGQGTCYVANDEVGAMREVLGPDYVPGTPVARSLFLDKSLWTLDPTGGDWSSPVANLRHEHWDGAGLTQEVFTISDYSLPQRWASAFFSAGYSALTVTLRHILNPQRFGLALFGRAGAQSSDVRFPNATARVIGDDDISDFAEETSIPIAPTAAPTASLHVIS